MSRRAPFVLTLLSSVALSACSPDPVPVEDTGTDTAPACVERTFYADADGDGYGDADQSTLACEAPSGFVDLARDCDDDDATVHPDAQEVCNGRDDDCDGRSDDDDNRLDLGTASVFFPDHDGDGFGRDDEALSACVQPTGFVERGGDCDDHSADIHPDAAEVCNGVDDDCDGLSDDADDSLDPSLGQSFFVDADGDGFGDEAQTTLACAVGPGRSTLSGDCDDSDPSTYPQAGDVYGDGVDSDCDTLDCEADWSGVAYFAVCPQNDDWSSWRSTCKAAGYDDLASISDALEAELVLQLLDDAGFSATQSPWLGLNDRSKEGKFVWADGSDSSYRDFSPGEPNNSGGEDCVHINHPLGSGGWNDLPCSRDGSSTGGVCGLR
ncbi:MAG: MopE-related protein [Myxococcota bacterium]|nr:MopE-related protein [Myxococcota bacterium]